MKKFIFVTVLSLAAAACSNAPKMSESATAVQGITTWVDSIKAIVDTTTTFDSAKWADLNAQFQNQVAGVNVEELDEVSKTSFTAVQDAFKAVGATYQAGIDKAKAKAAEMMNTTDSTAAAGTQTIKEVVMEKVEKAGEKVDAKAGEIKAKVDNAAKK